MFVYLKLGVAAVAVVGMTALGATTATAQSNILKAETSNPGAEAHAMTVVLAKIFKQKLGISTQVNDSQTLTRSAMKLGRGQIDWMPLPPHIYFFMTKGAKMYKKKLSKAAPEAAKNIRAVFSYSAVLFHSVTFANNGIKTWADIKGKRVFTGPPSGSAGTNAEAMIKVITGYSPNKDYTAIRLPWGSGLQAMMDGKLDVYVRPAAPGSAQIQQLGLSKKIRLLNAGDAVQTPEWKKWGSTPGRVTGVIPAGSYTGQVNSNESITTGGAIFQMAVRKDMSADLVYNMTKTLWANLDDIHKTAVTLKTIKAETPFQGMLTPLHPGAVKYYREKGLKIPARLIPPEAK